MGEVSPKVTERAAYPLSLIHICFDAPLTEGDRLLFGDMAIYTTCKNNTFNGMPLPPIWTLTEDGTCRELVRFGYNDFKMRLGHRA